MLLDRQFEKFIGGPTVASRDRMHVTISHKGLIYLNANTHRMLGRPVAANLYFNRVKDQIALEPTSARLPGVFPIHVKHEGFIINAGPFCQHFGIRTSGTQRFVEPEIDEKGNLLLDLSNLVTIGGWTRRVKSQSK